MGNLSIERLLVIEPHADDLILMGGGFVRKVVNNGGVVHRVTLTDGGAIGSDAKQMVAQRQRESSNSDELLGIDKKNAQTWQYGVRALYNKSSEVYDRLFILIRKVRPDTILTMHYDGKHPDHMWTGEFCEPLCFQVAERIKPQLGEPLTVNLLLGENPRSRFLYEGELFDEANSRSDPNFQLVERVLSGNPRTRIALPNYYVDITETKDVKIKAMKTQISQLDNLGEGIFDNITNLSRNRGHEAPQQCTYAEAFIKVALANPYH